MKRNNLYNRRSIRLKGYDYAQGGLYFITLCCQNRACLFGDVVNGEMKWNDAGKIADECWMDIPKHFPNSVLHQHIVMPNHIHGIIELSDIVPVGAKNFSPLLQIPEPSSQPFSSPSKTIGSIVRGYKIGVTKWMRQNTDLFYVWQRNYYEHIIRNKQSYQRISEYIMNNPETWTEDRLFNNEIKKGSCRGSKF
ncbi:MAG: transposase [Bacteroidales bacterium]|jgi:putative transposase|nr:transposase [Bacteroidales bacterium]MDD2687466.1 transposase [Bacteroidales bacterium]MDD3331117.1 transposase [Bacteroidales bacterium]MDD3691931.1 transposase [Bacteroidales bacterium]MDD4045219.1 transposase [Bacteroidales bacterium]